MSAQYPPPPGPPRGQWSAPARDPYAPPAPRGAGHHPTADPYAALAAGSSPTADPYAAHVPGTYPPTDPYAASYPGAAVPHVGAVPHLDPGPTGLPQDAYGYRLPQPGRRTGLIVAIVVGAVLLVGALIFAVTTMLGSLEAVGSYGDDPALDRLWDACAAGDGDACDDLYRQSPVFSDYEEFGDTCGGRFGPGEVWCSSVM